MSAVLGLAGVGCTWVRGWRGANTTQLQPRTEAVTWTRDTQRISRQRQGQHTAELQKLSPALGILLGSPDRSKEKVGI